MRLWAIVVGILVTLAPVAVGAGGGGGCDERVDKTGAALLISMEASCFGPDVLHVAPGETVRFVNDDAYGHTVTGAGLQWGSVEILPYAAATEMKFDAAGIYPYMCILHPGMAGAIVVADPAAAGAAVADASVSPSVVPAESGPALGPAAVVGAIAVLVVVGAAWLTRSRDEETDTGSQLTAVP